MKVNWSNEALDDLNSITDYIGQRNPQAALREKQKIIFASRQLAEFPFSGSTVDRPLTRRLVVPRSPYILIYRVIDGEVDLNAVLHASMDRAPDLQ